MEEAAAVYREGGCDGGVAFGGGSSMDLAKAVALRVTHEGDATPGLAEHAAKDVCTFTNPRPCSAEDYRRLFEVALS